MSTINPIVSPVITHLSTVWGTVEHYFGVFTIALLFHMMVNSLKNDIPHFPMFDGSIYVTLW